MGREKASLPFGGESLLDRVLRQVRQGADEIVLAAAAGQPRRDDLRVVRDATPAAGPLPAMLGALEGIGSAHVFVVACDAPLLQPALIPLLTALCAGWDAAVPVLDGRRMATCAVYGVAALRDAKARFGDPRHRSLQEFLQGLRVREVGADRQQERVDTAFGHRVPNARQSFSEHQVSLHRAPVRAAALFA